jgi:multidrug resistance efflux pump
METENITGKFKRWIFFGLTIPLFCAAAIGYGAFKHFHSPEIIQIENAKVTGTLVSARTLVDGKISELLFEDGEEVKAGEVIAA